MSTGNLETLVESLDKKLDKILVDHEARIRTLEKKNNIVTAVISGAVSILTTLIIALAGCSLPEPVEPTTVKEANAASVYIEGHYAPQDEMELFMCELMGGCGFHATAWFVDQDTLVTAGHACPDGYAMFAQDKNDDKLKGVTVVYADPVVDVCVMKLDSPEDWGYHGDYDLATDSEMELCDKPYAQCDKLWWWGYPGGEPAVYEGLYTGRVDDPAAPRLQISVPGWNGASGSAVLDKDGRVVGVLVESYVGNGIVIRAVPVEEVRKVLESLDG